MTKWLRKYNKVVLVIAGVVLMVGFLIEPAINQFGSNPGKRTVAHIGPDKARAVHGIELGMAGAELEAVREFCRPFSSGAQGEVLFNILNVAKGDSVHWFLLVEEAKRAGFVASQTDGAAWIPELAQQLAPMIARDRLMMEVRMQPSSGLASLYFQNPQILAQYDPATYRSLAAREQALTIEEAGGPALARLQQMRQQAAAGNRLTLEQFDTALTHLRGVMRMLVVNVSAPASISDRRAAAFGRRMGDSASIDLVFVTGSRLASSVPEPTPEQLAAHFQQYREAIPGTGEFGLGYLQPQRVRVAWLTLDRAAIAAAVETAPIQSDQLLERWSRNRVLYPGEFTAELERLRSDLRAQKTTEVLDLARRTVVQQVHVSTQGLVREGAYAVVPQAWVRPDLETVAQRVVAEVSTGSGIAIPLPSVTILNGRWQTRSDLDAQPGIGQSQMRQGTSASRFSDVVLSVKELAGENATGLQVGVPHVEQPLEDGAGNIYFVMVLDVRDVGPADSIDEVIDRVRPDYIALQGYELLRTQGESLRATAAAEGLDALAALFPPENAAPENGEPASALTVQRDVGISAQPQARAPYPYASAAFCEAVMEAARRLDPRAPATDQPVDGRTVACEVPAGLGVAVAQVVWFTPLTQERFRGFAGGGMFSTVLQEWQDVLEPESMDVIAMASFSAEELRARWQWVDRPR